jgi:predicted CXXCH cytochrome family protein
MRKRILWLGLATLLLVAAMTVPTLDAAPGPVPRAKAEPTTAAQAAPAPDTAQSELGPEVCSACHEDRVEAFPGNPHSLLDTPGWSDATGGGGGSCVSCHRGAAQHVEDGGGEGTIFAFSESEPVLTRTAVCQECHSDAHPRFQSTDHAAAGMTCTSCHTIHEGDVPDLDAPGGLLRSTSVAGNWHGGPFDEIGGASATCAECHTGVIDEFRQTEHHRLEEGVMSCSSCHDPHEPAARLALGGFDLTGCSDCHADKAGPFIFEHGSNRVEGCVACHTPHGSQNRHMLKFQNLGELCYSCHAEVPGFHVAGAPDNLRFDVDANCTNCHSSIHGSNFHPAFLK